MPVSRLPFLLDDLRDEILKEGAIDPDVTIMLDGPSYDLVTGALKNYTGDYVIISHPRELLEFRYRGVSIVRRADAKSPA